MNDIQTPRTDAALEATWQSVNVPTSPVPADFARKLERELAEAQQQIEANHKATLVIERMLYEAREQRGRLADAALVLAEEYEDRRAQWGDEYLWTKHEDTERVNAAIAAVKGEQP